MCTQDPITRSQVFVVVVSVTTVGLWCFNSKLQGITGEMGVIAILPLVAFFGFGILGKVRLSSAAQDSLCAMYLEVWLCAHLLLCSCRLLQLQPCSALAFRARCVSARQHRVACVLERKVSQRPAGLASCPFTALQLLAAAAVHLRTEGLASGQPSNLLQPQACKSITHRSHVRCC